MKKKFTLLSLLMALFAGSHAQYYYIPHLNAGQNPGGLNNDIEQPGTTGWAVLQATSATPVWSPNATIPFSFIFNGSTFTEIKVSTSGVATFTTSAVTVPSSTSAALPDANIPDNSICVWGLAGLGANDQIRTKTFGTAPNRQFWIQFNSYSCIGSTGWTYWGIVLEETSNKVFVVDQRSYQSPLALSIGLQFNSTTAISVAGSPALGSNATTTADDTPIDNSFFEFIAGVLPANEAELSSVMAPVFISAPGVVTVSGKLTNYGSSAITSITVNYQNGANVYSDVKTGLNIGFGASMNFSHNTQLNVSATGTYPIKVWIELAGDANQLNDTLNTTVTGVPFLPVHQVVFEEGTGTWCGWCPRGAVYMDSMHTTHGNETVLIAVHNADPMTVAAYDAGVSAAIPGYPSVLVNRKIVDDPSNMFAQFDDHINDFGYADLTLNTVYNYLTNSLNINVDAHFAADLDGDYRLSAVITEDHVTGTAGSYNQVNYYSSSSQNIPLQGAGHNWQNSPNPVPAAQMEYDHVARGLLGGFTGQAGSLPSTIAIGSNHSYTFNYPVPASNKLYNLTINVLLIDVANNTILNANKGGFVLGIDQQDELIGNFGLFPNPASESTTINWSLKKENAVKLEVSNMLGEVVFTDNLGAVPAGKHYYDFNCSNLNNGLYIVTLTIGNNRYTERIAVSK